MRVAIGLLGSFGLLAVSMGVSVGAAQVRLPSYSRSVLPNGIVLDVMPRRDVPLVTVRVLVKGGTESEPEQLAGVASVTAEALRRGTAKRNADQFSEQLDALGATFQAGVSPQATAITSEFLSKDLDAGLDLVLDAILQPTFPEAEMKKMLAQRIDSAKALKDNPAGAIAGYYNSFFFGAQHPYGRPPDEISLARITRKDVVDYHRKQFTGRNLIVVVAGDVQASAAAQRLTSALSQVPAGEVYAWKKAPKLSRAATRVAVIDKPDATQTRILIGLPGIERSSPDRVPLWVVNTYFGDRFTSVLNDELRVNSGLTYGARSQVDENRLPGAITINTFTRTETTGKTVDAAMDLLKKLCEGGMTAEQLQSTKNYIKGIYPTSRLETPDQLAAVVGDIELFDLSKGEVDDLFSRIDAVTIENVKDVVRKYFRNENLAFLLLGNADKFLEDIKKYAPEVIQVPITRPGLSVP